MSSNPESPSPTPLSWVISSARSGLPTAYRDGKALHSRFDPVREAQNIASTVPHAAALVVLAGLGLGYIAEALVRARPDRPLVIAEADPALFRAACKARDLSSLLAHPELTLLLGGKPQDIVTHLNQGSVSADIHLLPWPPLVAANPDWYQELFHAVKEARYRRKINAHTLNRFGKIWVRNLAANTPIFSQALSLKPWANKFLDCPALILAGGPSLDNILEHLPKLHKNHLLIAVDTALAGLRQVNTVPDVVVSVDPQYWNSRHLDRCGPWVGDALILAEAATHPMVFRSLSGRPWLSRTKFPLGTALEEAAGIEGMLKAGGSVATTAWELAIHLGCRPLSIAGLDLGFPGRQTHYTGSLSRNMAYLNSWRGSPAENFAYHALHDAQPYFVPSASGTAILSDQRMDVYAHWFSQNLRTQAAYQPATVGGEGRAIEGMGIISPQELLRFPNQRQKIKQSLAEIRQSPGSSPKKIQACIKEILLLMEKLETLAQEGLSQAQKAEKALRAGKDARVSLKAMDEIDGQLLAGGGRDLVSFLIQPLINTILQASPHTKENDPLLRSKQLYQELAESAHYHRRYLARARTKNESFS